MKIGCISDAHGNVAALERGLAVLKNEGVDLVAYLGDAIGYIPSADAAELIVALGLPAVKGNHEDLAFRPHKDLEREPIYLHSAAVAALSASTRQELQNWPEFRTFEDGNVHITHGSPNAPLTGYVYPDTDLSQFSVPSSIVIMGHTHRAFVRKSESALYVNAGSCALPRDTGGFGAVAVVDTCAGAAKILRFDIRDINAEITKRYSLHPSVHQALARPVTPDLIGEIVNV